MKRVLTGVVGILAGGIFASYIHLATYDRILSPAQKTDLIVQYLLIVCGCEIGFLFSCKAQKQSDDEAVRRWLKRDETMKALTSGAVTEVFEVLDGENWNIRL